MVREQLALWQKQLNFTVGIKYNECTLNKGEKYENIITSYCPETASEVAFKLLEKLTSTEQMNIVKEAMGFEI